MNVHKSKLKYVQWSAKLFKNKFLDKLEESKKSDVNMMNFGLTTEDAIPTVESK